MALPHPGMDIDPERTALVITDPQNDFMSPAGWPEKSSASA
jgi:biuret amidohydrolase